jgi:Tripartite tricarboxylate transporter family receptor
VERPVAESLARELKQTVLVENRVGAGGALGIGAAARAPADGYTLLLSLSSISILPEADRIPERKPAYTLNQFEPIARFTADPTVLVVRADAPWHTYAEFVADAKRKPTAYNYGSIEHCPNCGGSLKSIACPEPRRRAAIEDPPVIVKILAHLGLPTRAPPRSPAQRFDLFQTI